MMPAAIYTETPLNVELVSLSTINHSLMVFGIFRSYFINIDFFLQMQSSM